MKSQCNRSADSAIGQASSGTIDSCSIDCVVIDRVLKALAELTQKNEAIHQPVTATSKPFLTVAEEASFTGRSDFTVRRWIEEKHIEAIRRGTSIPALITISGDR